MSEIAYPIKDSLYLNITNRCTNECPFCIRNKSRYFNQQYSLWLTNEPTPQEILAAIGDPANYRQIVFCGYGEPLIRLEVVKAVAAELKAKIRAGKSGQPTIIRLDTNGQANLFWGRNVLPELKGLIDYISISLNAENAQVYNKLCHSIFGEGAFPAIIDFIKEAKKHIPQVEVSVIDFPSIDQSACRKIAENLGISFRSRPYYEAMYIE